MKGLVIVNWNYNCQDLNGLLYPQKDGQLMERMLRDGGYETLVLTNEENIRDKVREYINRQSEPIERFHFHYSGHGKHNVTIRFDPNNYSRQLNDSGEFETSYTMREDSDHFGDCIIGTSGQLYPVVVLKRDVLELQADTWTITLDMCRNDETNSAMRGLTFKQPQAIQRVQMSCLDPIEDSKLPRVGIIYGTSELHGAHDYHSFTEMLERLVRENQLSLQFTQISSLVNEAWADMGIKQKSKTDIVEIGRNWKSYYWPVEKTKEETREDSVDEDLFMEQRFRTSVKSSLMEDIEPILKFVLPRDYNTSPQEYFDSQTEFMEKIANSQFKTAMMLFLDFMKKIENNLIPTKYEINDLYVKATEGWNFLKDDNLMEKIKLSQVRLFCKYFELLINEEEKMFKTFNNLQENEKNFISNFVNRELSRLEELSRKRLSSRKNIKDFQKFTDEFDRIKILSYQEIKKEDYEEEHGGTIFKYWTLNANMVPEGENDALTSQSCTFRDSDHNLVRVDFLVFTDFEDNWIVKLRLRGREDSLPVSLCAIERRMTKIVCIYFPKAEREAGEVLWNLDMKHLAARKTELTLMFSFDGKLEREGENVLSEFSSTFRNIVEKHTALIRNINERPYDIYRQYSVSLTLVVCNFLTDNLWVKTPYFSSGQVDSNHKWCDFVQSSSVSQLYTRKRVLKARGTCGLTVLTTKVDKQEVGFVIHWVAPFDFNLYDNSFAVFPLSPQLREKDCKQIYKEIKNSNRSGSASISGIRGIAKDGPKAFQHRNILISARMGTTHTDCLQICFLPMGSAILNE